MNTIHNFPASKLPSELRQGLAEDAMVTITISQSTEFQESLQASFKQKEAGEGETFQTPQDMNAFFKARFSSLTQ